MAVKFDPLHSTTGLWNRAHKRFAYLYFANGLKSQDIGRISTLCRKFSPIVADDSPYGIILDISGCAHLCKGEKMLLQQLNKQLTQLNLGTIQGAIAPTVWAAAALAQARPNSIVNHNEMPEVLFPLALTALRLSEQTFLSLDELGIASCGDLLALPQKSLAQRFGNQLISYLDELLGIRPTALDNVVEEKCWQIEKVLMEPARSTQHLMKAVTFALSELCTSLVEQQLGIIQLQLLFIGLDKKKYSFVIGVSEASLNLKKLMQLITLRLGTFNAGLGIESISLEALQTAPLSAEQMNLVKNLNNLAGKNSYSQALLDVTPAKAGAQGEAKSGILDPGLRRDDKSSKNTQLTDLADLLSTRLGEKSFFPTFPCE